MTVIRPIQTRFRLGSGIFSPLTLPLPISRRLILQQARGQMLNHPPTACQLTVSCSISLPSGGSLSPFHRCTSSLSVTQEYLALRGGPRRFTRDSTCPMLLGIFLQKEEVFDDWTFTIFGAGFSCFVSSFVFSIFGFPQPH